MSIVNKILREAMYAVKDEGIRDEPKLGENDLEEVSTPTIEPIEPLTHDYYSPEEKEMKKKKAEREKGYREEGRYDGLY